MHYDIRVYGKVQGVFFRANTVRKATELGVLGWVKNEGDGSVLIAAEGRKSVLDKMVLWCKQGPSFAQVSQVIYSEGPVQNFKGFRIIR